jgi:hypothetical protein
MASTFIIIFKTRLRCIFRSQIQVIFTEIFNIFPAIIRRLRKPA